MESRIAPQPVVASPLYSPPTQSLEPIIARPSPEVSLPAPEKKGWSREKLKTIAFPVIKSRFLDDPFEVSKVRDLLDEMEPSVPHSYESAWNLCNDLLREGKLKQAGMKKLPKGVVRLFKLKSEASVAHGASETAAAGGGSETGGVDQ